MNETVKKKMDMKSKGIFLILGIVTINVLIIILYLLKDISELIADPLRAFVRLFALLGLAAMFISAMLTPFQKELYKLYKKPFVKIHHATTIAGLVLVTAHPVFFAIDQALFTGNAIDGLRVFIYPSPLTWELFFALAGRPAIYIIYVAVAGFLLRKVWKAGWRWIHGLNYIAMIFGLIHAILFGTDFYNFQDPIYAPTFIMTILFLLLFAGTITSFTIKRIRMAKVAKRRRERKAKAEKKLDATDETSEIKAED